MEFYRDVFGGNLTVSTFGELDPQSAMPDKIMHAMLESDQGFTLMASDTRPEMPTTPGDNITISLSGDDDDLRDYWAKLAEGGKVMMPLEKQVWGDEFGQLTDKFGINWMVNISQPQG
jgi:PhnB protein